MLRTLEPHGVFYQIRHTYICQHCLTTDMRCFVVVVFLVEEAMLSISPVSRGPLVKMIITFEPHGIFGSNFADFFILSLSIHWYANGDEALSSIILSGQGLLVKLLLTLEPYGIFRSDFANLYIITLS